MGHSVDLYSPTCGSKESKKSIHTYKYNEVQQTRKKQKKQKGNEQLVFMALCQLNYEQNYYINIIAIYFFLFFCPSRRRRNRRTLAVGI